jgi:prepilin-type N-terminal cleavage/methylation domain-containing protein
MKPHRRAGLSLLELLAVVVILGILALIVIPRISVSGSTAKEMACFQNKAEINGAVERYYVEHGTLPASIDDLDTSYFPDGVPNCPVTAAAYTLQAGNKRVSGHTTGSH